MLTNTINYKGVMKVTDNTQKKIETIESIGAGVAFKKVDGNDVFIQTGYYVAECEEYVCFNVTFNSPDLLGSTLQVNPLKSELIIG